MEATSKQASSDVHIASISHGRVTPTILVHGHRIDEARALLYQTYHVEQGWSPPPENPSNLRPARLESGEWGFVDRYDETCTWIGLSCEHRLVGCARLIARGDEGSMLELENYCRLPIDSFTAGPRLVELNRLAISRNYRTSPGVLMIMGAVLVLAQRNRWTIVTAARLSVARFAMRYGGMQDIGLRFLYHGSDPEEVSVLVLAENEVGGQLEVIQRRLANITESRISRMVDDRRA